MKPSSWNHYLSSSNPWTKRLIGLEPFSKVRDLEQIEREYNQDKYGSLLEFQYTDAELYKNKELELLGLKENSKTFISFNEDIFETEVYLSFCIFRLTISKIIKKYSPHRLCELGCGYGYNFSYLKSLCSEVYGGEYSDNAVTIANHLGFNVKKFNYYNLDDYQIIQDSSVILTVHSLEQLPSAKCFIDGVEQNKNNVKLVVNFEPSYIDRRNSLVGLLRNRYIEINDYNRDLLNLLNERKDIEIIEWSQDYIGVNPLNPTNLIVWRFK